MLELYDKSLAEIPYDLAARWDASREIEVKNLHFQRTDLKDFDTNQISK